MLRHELALGDEPRSAEVSGLVDAQARWDREHLEQPDGGPDDQKPPAQVDLPERPCADSDRAAPVISSTDFDQLDAQSCAGGRLVLDDIASLVP